MSTFHFKLKENPSRELRLTQYLSVNELIEALNIWIHKAQQTSFQTEIFKLREQQALPKNSRILALNPFLDQQDILRVGGRLQDSNLPYSVKHPIILDKSERISQLIIADTHLRYIHVGPRLMMSIIQRRYWIIGLRQAVKTHIAHCINCIKQRASPTFQLMGNLPSLRVCPGRAFLHTGVDYAGPVTLKAYKGRCKRVYKAYIALFVCFTTKATHIELVTELTTDAFLAALKRFVGRRGHCADITSDNATNFVGAHRQMLELRQLLESKEHNSEVSRLLTEYKTKWHFIPAASPNFGGIWEPGVKSVKTHLRRMLSNALLTYEEYNTVLIQIESCLNSRPIVHNQSATDFDPLTPGHFLIGEPLVSIPEPNINDLSLNRLSRWQYLTRLTQQFWKRWHLEYLTQLQARTKWKTALPNLQPDDLVLLKEESTIPCKWSLAKVISVMPGKDNLTRVVKLRCRTSELIRPISKICPLPKQD